MNRLAVVAAVAAVALVPAAVEAQRTPRRQQSIEIVGQVPTPQVVTVRPREMPQYDRRVLVPTFYDHDFWQSILPGYLIVRQRMITGTVPTDSMAARRDSAGTVPPTGAQPVTTTPPPTTPVTPPPATPPPSAATLGQPAAGPAQPPVGATQPGDDTRRVPPPAGSPALPPR